MKKLFSAFTAVLLAFCFISCAPQELSDRSSKNEGSVSLSIRSPRTISPAEGISYTNVDLWTVTFQDITTKYDVITVKDVNFNSSPDFKFIFIITNCSKKSNFNFFRGGVLRFCLHFF